MLWIRVPTVESSRLTACHLLLIGATRTPVDAAAPNGCGAGLDAPPKRDQDVARASCQRNPDLPTDVRSMAEGFVIEPCAISRRSEHDPLHDSVGFTSGLRGTQIIPSCGQLPAHIIPVSPVVLNQRLASRPVPDRRVAQHRRWGEVSHVRDTRVGWTLAMPMSVVVAGDRVP